MRVDHVSFAADKSGAKATAARLGEALGVTPVDGGLHPRFGTRNMILPLAHERYVEIVEVLDHPSADKAPFGQVVRARSEAGGGWLGWVVSVADITQQEQRLGRESVTGNRHRPDGVELRWKQLGVKGLQSDPQLPFFVEWAQGTQHPSGVGATQVALRSVEIAGDPNRVRDWVGVDEDYVPADVEFNFIAPRGTPGILSVTFEAPRGPVTV